MWLREESREAANTVSRCCWIMAPAPPRLSEIAAGPQASITDKKSVGTTRTSLDRDWRHTDRQTITHRHTDASSSIYSVTWQMKRLARFTKNLKVCNDINHALLFQLTDTAVTLTASPLEWVKRYHKVEQMPRLSRGWLGLVTVVVMFSMAFAAIRWTSKSVCKIHTNTGRGFLFLFTLNKCNPC